MEDDVALRLILKERSLLPFSGMIKSSMRKILWIILIIGITLALGLDVTPSFAQASSAYDVIAVVNDFRAANGLPPLEIDPILMSIAQGHSDYQASIRTVTHTGAGGTSVKDRAYAAGFGGGATIFVSENIAGGIHLSIQKALYEYWQDAAHLNTMLNPAAIYIGAGVGIAGDYVYYTVDAGYYSGATSSGDTTNPPAVNTSPGPTAVAYDPFVVSTPREDGKIIHTVGFGQSLIGIAKTYGIELKDIFQLNDLTQDSIIYPGEKIVIQIGKTLTPTLTPTEPRSLSTTATQTVATATPRISSTPRRTPSPSLTPSPTAPEPFITLDTGRERLAAGVVVMALVVFLAVVFNGIVAGKKGGP